MFEVTSPANGNRVRGLYTGNFHIDVLKKKNISCIINPLQTSREVLEQVEILKPTLRKDPIAAFFQLHDKTRVDGSLGILYDEEFYRPDGCLRADEVMKYRHGICLEQTFLFLSIAVNAGANDNGTTVIGFETLNAFNYPYGPHAFPGILVKNVPEKYEFLSYPLFDKDEQFHNHVLEVAGREREDVPEHKLLLLDLDTRGKRYLGEGVRHKNIMPMSNDQLLASYFTNSGCGLFTNCKYDEALKRYEYAMELSAEDHIAQSIIAGLLFNEKNYSGMLRLTSDNWTKLSPKEKINRLKAQAQLGKFKPDEMFKTLQLCIDFPEAYITIANMLSRNGYEQEAIKLLKIVQNKLEESLAQEQKKLHANTAIDPIRYKEGIFDFHKHIALLQDLLLDCLDQFDLLRK